MDHRLWMYDMNYENGDGLKPQYLDGVRGFTNHSMSLDLFKKMEWLGVIVVHVGA